MKILDKTFLALLILIIAQCGGKKEAEDAGDVGTADVDTADAGTANTPPVIDHVTLLPLNPTIQSEITARILSSDKEGNPITYRVRWFVNGKEIGEGMLFGYGEVQKGDKVYVEVTPFDGTEWGKPVGSGEITIAGLPPRILSIQIAPESIYVTTPQAVISAMVEDPDKDSIRLILHWLVKDKLLRDTSNVLKLNELGLKKHDVIIAAAFADDGEFRSEPFSFELAIANAPPVLIMKVDSVKLNPDSIYYRLPIIDPDEDPLTFEIIEAPGNIRIERSTGVIYGSTQDTTAFQIVVRAEDTEGAYLEAKFTLDPK